MKKILSHSFTKSQIAAFIGTAVDFLCLILFVELFNVWYVAATAMAAMAGALTNFSLGRHWSFLASADFWHHQAMRYFLVALGSLILNTLGVYTLTELLELQYLISKTIAAVIIGISFNYPLHRYYVFKITTATI